jgi:hypothetical protein
VQDERAGGTKEERKRAELGELRSKHVIVSSPTDENLVETSYESDWTILLHDTTRMAVGGEAAEADGSKFTSNVDNVFHPSSFFASRPRPTLHESRNVNG